MSIPYFRTARVIPCIPEARLLTTCSISTLKSEAISFAAFVNDSDIVADAVLVAPIASESW